MTAETVVIVAAYNEAERIGETLAALAAAFPGAPQWVADDGSTDRTPLIAAASGARVVRSEQVIGKGAAMTRAAREALVQHATPSQGDRDTVFVLCDGDLGASASQLAALADAVARGETDLAIAAFARRVGGGFGLAVGFARWAIRRRCGLQTVAPISGQRAMSASVLRDVLPFAEDFGMEVGMTIDAVREGYRVSELQLDLEHRATTRTAAGFAHRGRQVIDFLRVYIARRRDDGRNI